MNCHTEPTLKGTTEPASTISEGNNEGDYFISLYKTGYINAACFEPLKPITEVTVEGVS